MMRRILLLALMIVMLPAEGRAASRFEPQGIEQFMTPAMEVPEIITPLTLAGSGISGFSDSKPNEKPAKKAKAKKPRLQRVPLAGETPGLPLGPERARILLRSLTVPGWGQATLGRRGSAKVFAIAEAGVWGAFTAFRLQEVMRTQNYQRTARQAAGIDLSGRDEEFLRIVGAFASSDEYNLLVVSRDAANQYLADTSNPDIAGYRAYIAEHSLSGKDVWLWQAEGDFRRYGSQRKDAQRAALRANTALGIAIANRIVSALHAMRSAGQPQRPPGHSLRLEVAPDPLDPTAFHAGVRASF